MVTHTLWERVNAWKYKQPSDNLWYPIPGAGPPWPAGLPSWMNRIDVEAAVVDIAPLVFATGATAHLLQVKDFGFTAHGSPFHNPRTILATHRASIYCSAAILTMQATGIQYRQVLPRWASDHEDRRDEEQVRRHVDAGMAAGLAILLTRTVLRKGPTPSLMDVVLGGWLSEQMLAEYYRAHGL